MPRRPWPWCPGPSPRKNIFSCKKTKQRRRFRHHDDTLMAVSFEHARGSYHTFESYWIKMYYWYRIVSYRIVPGLYCCLCCIVLYCIVLYCIALYFKVLYLHRIVPGTDRTSTIKNIFPTKRSGWSQGAREYQNRVSGISVTHITLTISNKKFQTKTRAPWGVRLRLWTASSQT